MVGNSVDLARGVLGACCWQTAIRYFVGIDKENAPIPGPELTAESHVEDMSEGRREVSHPPTNPLFRCSLFRYVPLMLSLCQARIGARPLVQGQVVA